MYLLITGVPGTGKTTIAKELNKKFIVVNDRNFCIEQKLGRENSSKEQEISIPDLSKATLNLINSKKNLIFEGHLWAELPKSILKKMDFVFVLVASKTAIRKRLKKRKYPELKIIENVFSQETRYIENLLEQKKVFFYKINVNNNLKANLEKIKKHINF